MKRTERKRRVLVGGLSAATCRPPGSPSSTATSSNPAVDPLRPSPVRPVPSLLCLTQVTMYGSPSAAFSVTQLAVYLCSCGQSVKNKVNCGSSSARRKCTLTSLCVSADVDVWSNMTHVWKSLFLSVKEIKMSQSWFWKYKVRTLSQNEKGTKLWWKVKILRLKMRTTHEQKNSIIIVKVITVAKSWTFSYKFES